MASHHVSAATTVRSAVGDLAIICRVRTRHCAFFAADVVEVMRPLPIEGVANMPAFVLGLSIIRGAPTPVIDAGALLGDDRESARPRRFILVRLDERRIALAVEDVLGVRALAGENVGVLPPLLQHAAGDVITALGTLDARLLLVLGNAHLVPAEAWERMLLATSASA